MAEPARLRALLAIARGGAPVNYFMIGIALIGFALAVGAYVRVGQLEAKLREKGVL